MRRKLALTLLTILAIVRLGSGLQVQTEHTIVEEWSWRDNQGNGDSGGYEYSEILDNDNDNDGEEDYDDEINNGEEQAQANEDEDEESCEYSCPRYYRPVCVLRNGQPVTFGTPCEYYNKVRCASVQRRRGQLVPHFQYQYSGPC